MKNADKITRLEKQGWKIVIHGTTKKCHAERNNGLTKVFADSITELYKKIK